MNKGRRLTAWVSGAAMVVSGLAMTGVAASAAEDQPGDRLVFWGAGVNETYTAPNADWVEIVGGSWANWARTAGGGWEALPNVPANLLDEPPAVANGDVVDRDGGGNRLAAWAITDNGAVHKWGGDRGIVIPDGTWTPADLGGNAVEFLRGWTDYADVVLENGEVARIDSFGVSPVAYEDGTPLTGVVENGGRGTLLEDGSVVNIHGEGQVLEVFPADPDDPVTDVSGEYLVTESGTIYRYQVDGEAVTITEPTHLPTGLEGKPVQVEDANGSHAVVVTDAGEIVVWRPIDGGDPSPEFDVPASVADNTVQQLFTQDDSIGALVAEKLADLEVVTQPSIEGTATAGEPLTATQAEFSETEGVELSHQWFADGAAIEGATEASYTLTSDEVGAMVTYVTTATRAADGAELSSDPSNELGPVEAADLPALEITAQPSIDGTATEGETLTATPAEVNNDTDVTFTHQWFADGTAIEGATEASYTLTADEVGAMISYVTTATRGDDEVSSDPSNELGPVEEATVVSTTQVSTTRGAYGKPGRVVVRVDGSDDVEATGSVQIKVGGSTRNAELSDGVVRWRLPRTIKPGSYQVRASYGGSAALEPSAASTGYRVVKGSVKKIRVKMKRKPRPWRKGKMKVKVATAKGLKNARGKVIVKLKRNGSKHRKKVKARLNKRGKTGVRLPKLKRGKWVIRVKYKGNKLYRAERSKKYRIRVR